MNLDALAEQFDAGTVVTPELLREQWPDPRRASADQGARRAGDMSQEADGARAQVQRQGGREDRGSRRAAEVIAAAKSERGLSAPWQAYHGQRAQESLRASATCGTACCFTLALLGVYRVGSHVADARGESRAALRLFADAVGGIDVRPGEHVLRVAACREVTIFALGVMPYISASIIMQLLTVVVAVPRAHRRRKASSGGARSRSTRATGRWRSASCSRSAIAILLESSTRHRRRAAARVQPRAGASG